ncbi:MAG: hypothetical protein ACTSQI_18235 [Candidatus Helarchaeota archaeon]
MPILMKSQELLNEKIDGKTIEEHKDEIIRKLYEFLEFCKTQHTGSKYSLMGPAGKLLSLIKTTGAIDWGRTKGYITNVIRSTQNWIAPRALALLEEVCDSLALIKGQLTAPTQWLNIIDGIDYELFFQLFKTDRIQRDKYIATLFREFLQAKFKSIEELNKISEMKWEDFDQIPHPRDFPNPEIIENFWTDYKEKKENKKTSEKK